MLEASKLCCVRGSRRLFADLSFTLPAGQLLWVTGRNGTGKTSLLRMLCGLLLPESGTVRWNGEPIRATRDDYHADLLFLGHAPAVKDDLSGRENLRFAMALSGERTAAADGDRALREFGLSGREDIPARALSQGQRRRVALARLALSARRKLWILDEPFAALDVEAVQLVHERLSTHLQAGGSVVFTSHQEVDFGALPVVRLPLAA